MSSLLLLVGMAVGPGGLHILTIDRLQLLEPLVSLALVMIGISASEGRRATLLQVLPVAVAGVLLGFARAGHVDVMAIAAQATREGSVLPAVAAIALAGRLLIYRATGITERRVFLLGMILALSGTVDFADVAALPIGWAAGLIWRYRNPAMPDLRADLVQLSQPLTAALLVIVGAQFQLSPSAIAVAAGCAAAAFFITGSNRFGATPSVLMLASAVDIGQRLAPELAQLVSGTIAAVLLMELQQLRPAPKPAAESSVW